MDVQTKRKETNHAHTLRQDYPEPIKRIGGSMTIYRLLEYWDWYRTENPTGAIEGFLDYLSEQNRIGGGL